MKTQFLNDIMSVVSDVCEIPSELIISKCKTNDVVDARCMFVHFCQKYGFPSAAIMKYLGRRRNCTINRYLSCYEDFRKSSASFRLFSSEIAKRLAAKYPSKES